MSYDVDFWFAKPDQTFDDWAETFGGTYPPDEGRRLRLALDQVRTRVRTTLPDADIDDQDDGFALDHHESAISFGYSSEGVSLSCPYRRGAGSVRIPLMYEIAAVVDSAAGLRAWDTQIDSVASTSSLQAAIEAYERTARFAESLLTSRRTSS